MAAEMLLCSRDMSIIGARANWLFCYRCDRRIGKLPVIRGATLMVGELRKIESEASSPIIRARL